MYKCPACGREIEKYDSTCPFCRFPVISTLHGDPEEEKQILAYVEEYKRMNPELFPEESTSADDQPDINPPQPAPVEDKSHIEKKNSHGCLIFVVILVLGFFLVRAILGYPLWPWRNTQNDIQATDNSKNVSIPEKTTETPEPEIFSAGEYDYILLDDNSAEIVAFQGEETDITIPGELGGHQVFSIGESSFKDCNKLKSIIIPDGVTTIGESAFTNCFNLTSVMIPDSVSVIGHRAFAVCSKLSDIILPHYLEYIGEYAFTNCYQLTSITIPGSVTEIGANPFKSCVNLEEIHISSENPQLDLVDSVLFSKDHTRLITYPCGLKADHYIIPEDTVLIGNAAFADCPALTSITIPDSVNSIGDFAFMGCDSLINIVIPDGVTEINNSSFRYCSGLTGITIPDGVTMIGDYAFEDCRGLTSIILPGTVTSIGYSTFCRCTGLTNLTIPENVTDIDRSAFNGCENLIITVISGSYGEGYCKKYTIPFKLE